jgi:TrmH family RNA methyltransferase
MPTGTLVRQMRLPETITSRTNARVKALRAAFRGDASRPGDIVGIEGENLLREAVRSGLAFDTVYLREGNESLLDDLLQDGLRADEFIVLSKDVFASAVDTDSPQGIAATMSIPSLQPDDEDGVVLVLEDLQDPGNMGTLMRSAEAFQITYVLITPSSVNPWNPKAIRASAGSVFRIPVVRMPLTEIQAWAKERTVKLVAAVARAKEATPVMHARLIAPVALMVGNEGRGLSRAACEMSNELVNIPCVVESLNAATAGTTLMYEAFRQNLLQQFLDMPVVRGLQ